MAKLKENAISFFNSKLYPIFLATIIFIGHTFSCELFSMSLLVLCLSASVLICDDLRVAIAPVLMIAFSFSYKTFLSGLLGSITFLIVVIISLLLIFGSVTAHMILYKKGQRIKDLPKSPLFWGFVALSGGLLLNGFFNFKAYAPINITFALLLVFFFTIIYFAFYIGIEERKDVSEYVIFIFYVASVLLIAQMAVLLLRDATFSEGGAMIKESLILGWGMWNNVGGMLTMLLPVHFYYASTKKHGYIYYISAIITYTVIALTLSRSSLLFATVISIISVVLICVRGENKKINKIITLSLLGIGVILAIPIVILLWDKISAFFGSYINQGFNSNGRLDLYKHGLENFITHPIFGGGFDSCLEDNFGHGIDPNRYHNTIIELLATCGVVGFGAYCYHRYQTIKLFIKKKSDLSCIFLGMCALALLLTSLLDNHIFNLYPTMYYSIILVALGKLPTKENELS